jgi:XTP/dITP diphosphohydrolase
MKTLVVATHNKGKAAEIRGALEGRAKVETLADHPEIEMPPEDEPTFEGNARVKALHVMQALGVPVLADDSGLAVDALGGEPGVRSARYAPGSDADRIAKLIAAIDAVPYERRTARFVCAMVLAAPGAEPIAREGTCEGRIGREPRGAQGFGYDPVFVLEDGRTMAELQLAEKNRVSHRGRALEAMLPELCAVLGLTFRSTSER